MLHRPRTAPRRLRSHWRRPIAERPAVAMEHLLRVEQRTAARIATVERVAVPGEPGIGETDMLAVLVADIRDQQDLGIVRQEVFLDDMDFQLAKAPAERDLLFLGQMLAAEKGRRYCRGNAAPARQRSNCRSARDRSNSISAPHAALVLRTGTAIGITCGIIRHVSGCQRFLTALEMSYLHGQRHLDTNCQFAKHPVELNGHSYYKICKIAGRRTLPNSLTNPPHEPAGDAVQIGLQ